MTVHRDTVATMSDRAHAVHATAADLDQTATVLSDAFAADPVQQWLWEPAADPHASRLEFFRFFVGEYFALGHVYVVHDASGVVGAALWAPPDRNILGEDRIPALLEVVVPAIGDETFPRLGELAKAAEQRPAVPHFYLGILGVAPRAQGRGLGERLVVPVLDACDVAGFVAHLESSNPANISFYERLGFVTADAYRCGGADGPLMTIMTRQPPAA